MKMTQIFSATPSKWR